MLIIFLTIYVQIVKMTVICAPTDLTFKRIHTLLFEWNTKNNFY